MKKRLAAFVTAMILLFSVTVHADYYTDTERSEISFSEMLEFGFDYEAALKGLEETESLIEKGAPITQIIKTMDNALPPDEIDFITRNNIDYILASINNSEENNAIYTENSNYVIDIQQKLYNILKKLFESKHREDMLVMLDLSEDEVIEFIESMPSDEEYAIQKEINNLSELYYNSMFGSYVMDIDGEKYNFSQLMEAEPEVIYKNYNRYFSESADILGPLFINMVSKRNELAAAAGYKNYMEYAFGEIYKKDYTSSDRKAFYKYTAKYIVPLYTELVQLRQTVYKDSYADELDMTEDEILAKTRESLERINPELTGAYDYMLEYGLYDIGMSEDKRQGGFTTKLDFFGVPFTFINPEGSPSNMFDTLVHEYGHFNAGFHDPLVTDPEYETEYDMNLDIAEIHSQGMEMLFMDELGRFYGNDAPLVRLENLMGTLDAVIAGSLYSMWLERVYEASDDKDLTVDRINELFILSCEEMGVEDMYLYTDIGCEWIMVPHNFEVPFYYISYGVSGMTALEIFNDIQHDRDDGIDKYMKLTALGEYVPFKKTIEESGYSNIFAESTFNDVVNTVKTYTGLRYGDISEEDWSYPYILRIANFIEPASADRFDSLSYATRISFVEALGRMEEDVYGIQDTESVFSDTESSYVAWAADEGIVAGVSETEFGAEQFVTREQIICFLYRMAGEPEVSGMPKFADRKNISDWASDAILWAQQEGIASGYTDNTFRPKNNVTRGEAAKFLADAYEIYY